MTCTGHIFHPTDPCCGTPQLCRAFPHVDWSRYGWLVTVPAATLYEQRFVIHRYPGSPAIVFGPDDPDNYKFAYRSDSSFPHDRLTTEPTEPPEITTTDVLHSQSAYHCRGGRFRSRYIGGCRWTVRTRERLCPDLFPLLRVDKGSFVWLVSPNNFVPAEKEWTGYRTAISVDADPLTGPFVVVPNVDHDQHFSWRDVLRAGECELLPSIESRELPYFADGSIEGGLLYRLEQARDNIASDDQTLCDAYEPTAMDLAVADLLHESLTFGTVADPLSTLYGRFVIFQNATYSETGTLLATAWELTSGDEVIAEVGTVNRFERTNDNATLPDWVNLELVPL